MTAISAEELRAIIAGCEGVTPGPWRHYIPDPGYCDDYVMTDSEKYAPSKEYPFRNLVAETGIQHAPEGDSQRFTPDAQHIARCDPATIRAMAELALQAQEMREALQGVIAVADRDTVEFDRARRALSPLPREDVTNGCEAREARYVPRPHKLPGLRIPVHVMRRFFNLMGGGRCVGIEVAHRGSIHGVTIHFDTAAEASGFYRSLQAIYELGSE